MQHVLTSNFYTLYIISSHYSMVLLSYFVLPYYSIFCVYFVYCWLCILSKSY